MGEAGCARPEPRQAGTVHLVYDNEEIMTPELRTLYLVDVQARFRSLHTLAERAIAQIGEQQLFSELSPDGNSIARLMKHIAGNMRSRWTDFLTSDGEKPDRNRDREFEIRSIDTAESLKQRWEAAWALLFSTLESLAPQDLDRTVQIRGEQHSVVEAINRQMIHYAMHVGQIVFVAKTLRGQHWRPLSIVKGGSANFTRATRKGQGTGWHKGMPEAQSKP